LGTACKVVADEDTPSHFSLAFPRDWYRLQYLQKTLLVELQWAFTSMKDLLVFMFNSWWSRQVAFYPVCASQETDEMLSCKVAESFWSWKWQAAWNADAVGERHEVV